MPTTPIGRRTPMELGLVISLVAFAAVSTAAWVKTQRDIADLRQAWSAQWTTTHMHIWIEGANRSLAAGDDLPTVDQVQRQIKALRSSNASPIHAPAGDVLSTALGAGAMCVWPMWQRPMAWWMPPRRKSGGRKNRLGQLRKRRRMG